jgi:hypothetical protein
LCWAQCEGAEFLWHAEGLRRCSQLAEELRGRVLENYVCRRCPTWVQNTRGICAVLGCGGKDTFEWWQTVTMVVMKVPLTKAEALAKPASEHPTVDVKFKPFWHLGAYCPNGQFFDTEEPGCKFEPESGFRLHRAEMSFGYEEFRLECCKVCERCDASLYRMNALYRACTGESVRDTQAQACGDRCESGFYVRNETALECVACHGAGAAYRPAPDEESADATAARAAAAGAFVRQFIDGDEDMTYSVRLKSSPRNFRYLV